MRIYQLMLVMAEVIEVSTRNIDTIKVYRSVDTAFVKGVETLVSSLKSAT